MRFFTISSFCSGQIVNISVTVLARITLSMISGMTPWSAVGRC